VGDGVTCTAHQGVTCNPPYARSHLFLDLCLQKPHVVGTGHIRDAPRGKYVLP